MNKGCGTAHSPVDARIRDAVHETPDYRRSSAALLAGFIRNCQAIVTPAITDANAAFVEVSGFERSDILGQPHSLVRHPDMPTQAFADMWATLKAGQSWTALVKNRRKNGDHGRGRDCGSRGAPPRLPRRPCRFALLSPGPERAHGAFGFLSLGQTMPVRWRPRAALAGTIVVAVAAACGLPAMPPASCGSAVLPKRPPTFFSFSPGRPREASAKTR
jgi:hypothetical protein